MRKALALLAAGCSAAFGAAVVTAGSAQADTTWTDCRTIVEAATHGANLVPDCSFDLKANQNSPWTKPNGVTLDGTKMTVVGSPTYSTAVTTAVLRRGGPQYTLGGYVGGSGKFTYYIKLNDNGAGYGFVSNAAPASSTLMTTKLPVLPGTGTTTATIYVGADSNSTINYDDLALFANYTTPSAPRSVSATSGPGKGQVTVSWTAPKDSGVNASGDATITGYTVSTAGSTQSCETTGTSCVLSGLDDGTSYTFSVVATNSVGDGDAATVVKSSLAANTLSLPQPAAGVVGGSLDLSGGANAPTSNSPAIINTVVSGPCTLTGSTLTYLHVGTCSITAQQAQTSSYLGRQVTKSVTIGQGTPALTFGNSPPNPTYGGSYQPYIDSASDGDVTLSIANPGDGNCVLDNGTVFFTGAGHCAVQADQAATTDYTAAQSALQEFDIDKADQDVNITSDVPSKPTFGGSYVVSTNSSNSGNPVTISVVDNGTTNNACSVDNTTVSLDHSGWCTIKARQSGSPNYYSAKDTQTFFVRRAPQSLTLSSGLTAVRGTTSTVQAVGSPSGNAITWFVSGGTTNDACVIVGQNNSTLTLQLDHAGVCGVTAQQAGSADWKPVTSDEYRFLVTPSAQTISLSTTPSGQVSAGGSQDISVVGDRSGQVVTMGVDPSSTSGSCSAVGTGTGLQNGTGLPTTSATVSFTAQGTCVVTFSQQGSADWSPTTMSVTFTVGKAQPAVAVWVGPNITVTGQQATASATVTNGGAGTVQFALDGTPVGSPVTVANGVATSTDVASALAVGNYQVTAAFTPTDTTTYGSATSAPFALAVGRASTTSSLVVGQKQLSVTVAPVAPGAGTPTGTVQFSVAGSPVGTATLTDGRATLAYSTAPDAAQQVAVAYSGDTGFAGSSASSARSNPTINATVTGSRSDYGWYRGTVTVAFSCAAATAPLVNGCPETVQLWAGGNRSITRTITAADGGIASVTVNVRIDQAKPTVRLSGVRAHAAYRALPAVRCAASDALSGVADCRVTRTVKGDLVTFTAAAVDKAGNVGRTSVTVRKQR